MTNRIILKMMQLSKVKAVSIILLISSFLAITGYSQSTVPPKKVDAKDEKQKLTYKVISSINNTWGYDIYIDDVITIHQSSIPCINGNEGFNTTVAAKKVACIVINKIKKGEMPPSVSIEEMKKIKAIP